jgi:hypothetical protein
MFREFLRNHSEDSNVDEKIILECILGKLEGGVDWMHLAQDTDQWRTLVNFSGSIKGEEFLD